MPRFIQILLIASFCFVMTAHARPLAPVFNNLGHFDYPVTTSVPLAQRYFNQGMVLFYGFEWNEAARSFQAARVSDPKCAMCYWGEAITLLYKINAPEDPQDLPHAKNLIKQAVALPATDKEKAIIATLAQRLQQTPSSPIKAEKNATGFSCHHKQDDVKQQTLAAYSAGLKKLITQYPNDNEIKVLYALSIFWGEYTKPKYNHKEVDASITMLSNLLQQDPNNIGANHYYIHFVEATATPGNALASADRFNTLVPGSEHLVHMPAHIYFLTGRYHQATLANTHATDVFLQYNKSCQQQGFKPAINYLYFHNYDFLRSSATVEGRRQVALTAAQQILAQPLGEWLKVSPDLQWFIPIIYYVQARFGLWEDILNTPAPSKQHQYALGMWHYAHGLALVHTNKTDKAMKDLSMLNNIVEHKQLNAISGEQGKSLLRIAREVLAANIDSKNGFNKSAEQHLQQAVSIQDKMGYHEPPDWSFPMREALGDFYLHIKDYAKAQTMFNTVLRQYPQHPWVLYKLWQVLAAIKDPSAERVHQAYLNAWKRADIDHPIPLI